jgi:hypothetical protein
LGLPATKLSKVIFGSIAEPESASPRGGCISRAGRGAAGAVTSLVGWISTGSTLAASRGRAWPLTRTVKCSRPMAGVSCRNASRIFSA